MISDIARNYLRLHMTPDVGPIRLRALLDSLGSVDAVLSASRAELQRADGVGPKVAEAVFRSRTQIDVDAEVQRAAGLGLGIVCWEDADYPPLLRNIPDPPICLYVKGSLDPTDAVSVAMVGTRRCSHYGREQALRFAELLAGAGFTVVSGLARGVDGCAHQGALRAGGRTIAVLGNGLSAIYPPEHESLADEIAKNGAIVSELPVDVAPEAGNFPRRNRIIVGLSLGVIVVEAGKNSGALITARLAMEYNREVFAVPGRIDQSDRTAGVHSLIRDGHAKLITCLEDVLDELGEVGTIMRHGPRRELDGKRAAASEPLIAPSFSETERAIIEALGEEPTDTDSIISRTGLEPGVVMSALTSLQLKGALRQLSGGAFVRRGIADASRR